MQNTANLVVSSLGYVGTLPLRGVVGGEAFLPREHMKPGTGLYAAIGEELGHRLQGSVSVVPPATAHIYESLCNIFLDEAHEGLSALGDTRVVASHLHQLVLGVGRDATLKAQVKGKKLITWPQLLGEDTLVETEFGAPDGVVMDVADYQEFPVGMLFAVLQKQ